VATRLGAAGATLHRLATGESAEPLIPTPPVAELSEEQALLDPIDNLEPLLFILRGLLDRLVARLRARGQACGDLNLRLVLVPRGEEVRRIAVAAPTQKVAPLLDLVRVCLEGKPPPATVEKLVLSTMPTRPRPTQLDLFSPAGPAPERLAATLARLEALCGSGRVGMPVLPDTHAPSAAALAPFKSAVVAPIKPAEKEPAQPPPLLLAARVVRPPQPVAVQVRGAAPAEVDLYEPSRGADKGLFGRSGRKPDKSRLVRRAGGPYRLRDVRGARDYYDVELDDGALYRLFYDMTEKSWFLDAVYD
jgi:protein ImuB